MPERMYSVITGSYLAPLELTPEILEKVRAVEGVKFFDKVWGSEVQNGAAMLVIEAETLDKAAEISFKLRCPDGIFPREHGQVSDTYCTNNPNK